MKDIDFTPDWYVEQVGEQQSVRRRLAGLVLVIVLVLVWSYQSSSRTRAVAMTLEHLQHSHGAQAEMMAQLDALEGANAQGSVNARLLTAVGGGLTVSGLLTELSHLMPRTVSIRSLYLQKAPRIHFPPADERKAKEEPEEPPATALEITGWASTGSEIGTLVSRMSASELFYDVALKYERPETVSGRKVVEFLVVCRMPEFE